MNELFDFLLDTLAAPRVLAACVLSAAGAIFLAAHVPWFSGSMGLSMVILSTGAGLVWEALSEQAAQQRAAQRRAAQGQRVSRVFLAVLLCAAGLAWMLTSGSLVSSFEGRLAILAGAPFAVGGLYALVFWRPVPLRPMLFAAVWLCSGVCALWWGLASQGYM